MDIQIDQTEDVTPQSSKIAKSSARLAAVQAFYQLLQNKQPVADLVREYLDYRSDQTIDGEPLAKPDGVLLQSILLGVYERRLELDTIVESNLTHKKEPEFLLKSILMCASYEILAHSDIDTPIIINDYLNVTHAFFGESEVKLVNGVLDSIADVLR